MQRRLLLAVLPLLLGLLCALAIPAAIAVATARTDDVIRDRATDADRFATELLTTTDPEFSRVRIELDQYARLHGTHAWIVDRTGALAYASPGAPEPGPTADEVRGVLAGRTPEEPSTAWPWSTDDLRIVVPAGYDSGVVAAVVLAVPTDRIRAETLGAWAGLAAIGAAALGAVLLLRPMSRWVLRPLDDLERTTAAMARGDFEARPGEGTGPPEVRALTRSFHEMAEVVSRTLRRQRRFVSDASHQLRTPLAGVRLSVETLAPHVRPGGDEAYRDALTGIERMGDLLEGLLAATRADARAQDAVAVDALVRAALPRWRELAACAVRADVERGWAVPPAGGLDGVLDELVANAARHGSASEIVVRGRALEGTYRVEVADDGVGVRASELGLVTLRFWRAERSQRVAGTGQGLAIVDELVSHAGGGVRVEANEPHGLVVVVELRGAEAPQPDRDEAAPGVPPVDGPGA